MRKRKARELIAWFSVWRQFRRKRVTLETSFLFLVRLSTAVQKTSPRSGSPEIFEGGGGGRKLPINVTRGYSQIIRQLSSKMRSYPCHDFRQTDSWRKLIGLMR